MSLLAAVVLYIFAIGVVKGFAFALGIGQLAFVYNFFANVFHDWSVETNRLLARFVSAAAVTLPLRDGCGGWGALTRVPGRHRMRLQLQTASTGTSTRRTATAASRNGASRRGTTRVNGPASLAPKGGGIRH